MRRKFRCAAICMLLWLVLPQMPGRASVQQSQPGDSTRVTAGGRTLFFLNGNVGSFGPAHRARLVNERITRILSDPSLDPRSIEARTLPDGSPGVALGNLDIVEVGPADVQAAGQPAARVADEWARQLRSSLVQLKPLYERQRTRITVQTLSEHHILLLIIQVAALLLVARAAGEAALRLGQPPVIGHLLAGILLGQSVLGALWPDLKALVFPVEATQGYLLEVVSWLGVLFLLMLTGLETDLALIRQQGRQTLLITITGILFPFLLGALFGWFAPPALLTTPESRPVLSVYLGTLLSVSSVPVIAKILIDMGLLRRNVGQLILASALAHDTIGWLILGVVASLAGSGSLDARAVIFTIVGTLMFLGLSAWPGLVLVRSSLRWVNDYLRAEEVLLSAVVILTLVAAGITQALGVHAVLGAFVMGILLRHTPVVSHRVLLPIEQVTAALFAPVFFAAAGLHVNLAGLVSPNLLMLALVLTGAAIAGKVLGCYWGAVWGGLDRWSALSVGVGTNARGAMGLIVGILGFSLGILTVDIFSLIIVMAIITTAMTPSLLKWTLLRTPISPGESERLHRESLLEKSFIGGLDRVLLPTRGGPHAQFAMRLLNSIAGLQKLEVTALYVKQSAADRGSEAARSSLVNEMTEGDLSLVVATEEPSDTASVVLEHAARGYDLVAIGCGSEVEKGGGIFGAMVDRIVQNAAPPVLVVRGGANGDSRSVQRILVPTSGAQHSVFAAEFAVAAARATGASLTVMHVHEDVDDSLFWLEGSEERFVEAGQEAIEQVRALAEAYGVPVHSLLVRGARPGAAIVEAARREEADLVVLGSRERPGTRLSLGPGVTAVLQGVKCAVVILRS